MVKVLGRAGQTPKELNPKKAVKSVLLRILLGFFRRKRQHHWRGDDKARENDIRRGEAELQKDSYVSYEPPRAGNVALLCDAPLRLSTSRCPTKVLILMHTRLKRAAPENEVFCHQFIGHSHIKSHDRVAQSTPLLGVHDGEAEQDEE